MKTYNFFTDPGHGWLEVPMTDIQIFGLEGKISGYSYISRNGKTAYLEEDCDYSLFLKVSPEFEVIEIHQDSDSFIRDLPKIKVIPSYVDNIPFSFEHSPHYRGW